MAQGLAWLSFRSLFVKRDGANDATLPILPTDDDVLDVTGTAAMSSVLSRKRRLTRDESGVSLHRGRSHVAPMVRDKGKQTKHAVCAHQLLREKEEELQRSKLEKLFYGHVGADMSSPRL